MMSEQKSGIVVEGLWGVVISEIASCVIYSFVILMWCLSPVSNTYRGVGRRERQGPEFG